MRPACYMISIVLLLAVRPAAATEAQEQAAQPNPAVAGEVARPETPQGTVDAYFERKDPVGDALIRAWGSAETTLSNRVRRTQTAAAELGLRDVEGASLAVLRDPEAGSDLERSLAAVALAPGLPAAHFALASTHWRDRSPFAALGAAADGIASMPGHLIARLWGEVALWTLLARSLLWAGLWYLAGICLLSLVPAARALPRPIDGWPMVSSLAIVAALLLLPAALGEGVLGLVVGAVCITLIPAGFSRRLSVLAAAGLVWLALFPGLERQGQAAAMLAADPVTVAAWQMARGVPARGDLIRFQAAAASDPEAAHALALRARREGRFELAAERFEPLLASDSARVRNDAANVSLALGRASEAIDLYEAAALDSLSPLLRVNLSQAYGTLVRLDQQDLALAEAQSIDAREAADLANVLSSTRSGTTFDFPVAAREALVRARSEEARQDGHAIAKSLRTPVAPGALGRTPTSAAAVLALTTAVGLALALLGRGTPPERRRPRHARRPFMSRLLAGLRSVAKWTLPGMAGLLSARPLLGLVAVLLASLGLSLSGLASLPIVDPLAVGSGLNWIAFGGMTLLGVLYVAVTSVTLALGERS